MSSRHEFISTFGFARGMWIHEEHSGGITYHIINENHYDDVEEDRSGRFLSSLSYVSSSTVLLIPIWALYYLDGSMVLFFSLTIV